MATIQQSIEIDVPVHTLYNQLTQFEDYPRFMQDVETVQQLDDTHLHWSAKMSYQTMEWDSEITEQLPDRLIAWRNANGPINGGRVEVEAVDDKHARVTLTMDCDPQQLPAAQGGDAEAMMAGRIEEDLARLKEFIEARGAETGEWRGEVHGSQVTQRDRDVHAQRGDDGLGKTVGQTAGEQHDGAASAQPAVSGQAGLQQEQSVTSGPSMSQSSDDDAEDGRYSIAEEQNFDQQSDQARRVGQMPLDVASAAPGETNPADAMAKSMEQDDSKARDAATLKQSMDRSVPPSE